MKQQNWFVTIIIFAIAFCLQFACKKELSCENCFAGASPIANAGLDTIIELPLDSIVLDGSTSIDPDGEIIKWTWTKISGPDGSIMSNSSEQQPLLSKLAEGTYLFELEVTDDFGNTAKDTVQIVVMPLTITCVRAEIQARLIPVNTLSLPRTNMLVATAGNKIVFGGGLREGQQDQNVVNIYDISTNTATTASLSEYRTNMAIASVGNKIFFAGGNNGNNNRESSRVDIYDVTTNKWDTAELSIPRTQLVGASVGSKVFFAGGWSNQQGIATRIDIYDNSTDTWSVADLLTARAFLTATTIGDKIYFAGGLTSAGFGFGEPTSRIDIFNATTSSWEIDNLQYKRAFHSAIAVDSRIFWAGGRSQGSLDTEVEIKNMNTGEITFHCLTKKKEFTIVRKGEYVVFFTGLNNVRTERIIYDTFDIYNTATDTWYNGILDRKIVGAAVISIDNIIYVAGGTDGSNSYNQLWKLEF